MFKKLLRKLNESKVRQFEEYDLKLSANLYTTVQSIENIIGESSDIHRRDFTIGQQIAASLFYIEGLCDVKRLERETIRPLQRIPGHELADLSTAKLAVVLEKKYIEQTGLMYHTTFDSAFHIFMKGNALLVVDGIKQLITIEAKGFETRQIEEPQNESTIRGSREGFIESLHTNIMLLRRRIKDPNLIVQTGMLGRRSKNEFSLLYVKGIAKPELIEEARYRISCVDTDHVPDAGSLEELIEDNVLSVFPQIMHTERPDKSAAALLNGQILIMLDGSPSALIAPITFQQFFKSPEDLYERWHIGTLIRILRYLACFIALFLPSLYIAMVSFHEGMIPTTLALSIAGSREGVPFPAFIEALLMELTIELLREAGVRLPRPIGQTIGIVGGLVIGDAAVRAGIVSPIMVIVVALTTIASFAMPSYSASISFRMLRFALMVAAAVFGLYGIVLVYILINIHLVGLKSFGSFYLSPFAPFSKKDWKDLIMRFPLSVQRTRTSEPGSIDKQKQK